jgi:hypothetical protein
MKIFVRAAPGHDFMIGNAALGHPIDGPVSANGSYWESDFFTFRMRDDGDIVVDDTVAPLMDPAAGPEALRAVSRTGNPV